MNVMDILNSLTHEVDPRTVRVRARDTELLPSPKPPSEWGAPFTVAEMLVSEYGDPAYNLAFLAASQLPGARAIVTVAIEDGDRAVRNIDYEITRTEKQGDRVA